MTNKYKFLLKELKTIEYFIKIRKNQSYWYDEKKQVLEKIKTLNPDFTLN